MLQVFPEQYVRVQFQKVLQAFKFERFVYHLIIFYVKTTWGDFFINKWDRISMGIAHELSMETEIKLLHNSCCDSLVTQKRLLFLWCHC